MDVHLLATVSNGFYSWRSGRRSGGSEEEDEEDEEDADEGEVRTTKRKITRQARHTVARCSSNDIGALETGMIRASWLGEGYGLLL